METLALINKIVLITGVHFHNGFNILGMQLEVCIIIGYN